MYMVKVASHLTYTEIQKEESMIHSFLLALMVAPTTDSTYEVNSLSRVSSVNSVKSYG